MPAVSQSQFRKMFILYRQGKITKAELDRFTHGVNFKKLPNKTRKRKARRKGRR